MLVNFCDPCLRSDVICSTVSTEGYEVTNLTNSATNGFLAYSCIKPPVTIDLTFICNVQISHILLWPKVGAQKSSGFQIFVKPSDDRNETYVNVSYANLKKEEDGVLFYRRDINREEIPVPTNFVRCAMKNLHLMNRVSTLRINIFKTENSVPALGRIEVWGRVSPIAGKDVVASISSLWINRNNVPCNPKVTAPEFVTKRVDVDLR